MAVNLSIQFLAVVHPEFVGDGTPVLMRPFIFGKLVCKKLEPVSDTPLRTYSHRMFAFASAT